MGIRNSLMCGLLLAGALGGAFAASYHTVPLDSRAYDIITVGELRGLIPKQSDVRPYSVDTVVSLLERITQGTDSSGEKDEIRRLVSSLKNLYDSGESWTTWDEVRRHGAYRTEEGKWGNAQIGLRFDTHEVFGAEADSSDFDFDSRNGMTFYLMGNFAGVLSYDMSLGLHMDKFDPDVFLFSDFSLDGEGFYKNFLNGGGYQDAIPFDDAKPYMGLYLDPELDGEFFDHRLKLRFASIKRDWGSGVNNIELSASARSFPAVEAQVDLAPWLHFSVLAGGLGVYKAYRIYDSESDAWREFPSEHGFSDKQGYSWDNNFSAQRIEVDFPGNLRFSIYESVIYKKRFEFAYLNPLSVYMFDQNGLGDLDNMLAGVELSWNWVGHANLYASVTFTELNTINILNARDIMGYQAGANIPVPWLSFGQITLQATYLSPFFYSHYADDDNPWEHLANQAYVNKGFPLGYPIDPDTLELLARYDTGLGRGWSLSASLRSQFRSAQYATNNEYGTTILTSMVYAADKEYARKDFLSYIWSNVWSLDLTVKKRMERFPAEFTFGLRAELDFRRDYDVLPRSYDDDANKDVASYVYNPGTKDTTIMGGPDTWRSAFGLYGIIGVTVYY